MYMNTGVGAQGAGAYRGAGVYSGGAMGGGGMAGGGMAGGAGLGAQGAGVYRGGGGGGGTGGVFVGGAGNAGMAGVGGGNGGCGCGGPGCLGCGASCGEATGCGGGVVTGGALTYVGAGGDWITETTYKYVGAGAGNLTAVVPASRGNALPCVALMAVMAVVALVVLLMPGAETTTTTVLMPVVVYTTSRPTPAPPAPEVKTCLFWGDPHIVSFDGARPSVYGDGEFWVVKNDRVHIQGRYLGTKYTYGLAATQKVAIGGPFLEGNTIEIEPMEQTYGGRILINGKPVLSNFGQERIGHIATIDYNGNGQLVDEAASVWTERAVHLQLPMGVHMTVFRWGNYLDMKITMPKLEGGVDGSCGNFNDDASDDTPAAIFQRVGARLPRDATMFSTALVVDISSEEKQMLKKQCPHNTLTDARATCSRQIQGATDAQVESCSFDVCFGMNEHALRSAKNFATVAEERAAHSKHAN